MHFEAACYWRLRGRRLSRGVRRCYPRPVNEDQCHLALSVARTTSDSGHRLLPGESAAIVAPAVASVRPLTPLASPPPGTATHAPSGSPSSHCLTVAQFATDCGAAFRRGLTVGIVTSGPATTSSRSHAEAQTTSATFNPPAINVTQASVMEELQNPATPNHALQRTAPGVTACAPAASLRSPPAAFPHRLRRPPQSLSLGSLGLA